MRLLQTNSFELAVYANGDEGSSKLALVLPGKLDTKDYPHMRSHVDYLSQRGYYAVSFDPPGTWESSGDISLYTMTNYLKAINELIEYFGNKPTFVIGHSRGGSMAMLSGTTNAYITGFVSVMSWYTFTPDGRGDFPNPGWQELGYRIEKREVPRKPNEFREFRLPYGFLEDQIQYDMSAGLKECTKPKLFFLGKKDITVLPEAVKAGYEVAAEPKKLYELDSAHDYRFDMKIVQEVNEVVGGFLNQRNSV